MDAVIVAPAGSSGVLRPPSPPPVVIPPITPQQLDAAASAALERVRQRLEFLAALFNGRVFVQEGTPAAWHQEFFQTTEETLQQGVQAQKNVEATVGLVEELVFACIMFLSYNIVRDISTSVSHS